MSRNCTHLVVAAALASLTGISGALAAENWPPSVVGTWGATANQTPLTIVISSQASTGKCPVITGTIFQGVSPTTLSGVYCPGSGRIVHTHRANTEAGIFREPVRQRTDALHGRTIRADRLRGIQLLRHTSPADSLGVALRRRFERRRISTRKEIGVMSHFPIRMKLAAEIGVSEARLSRASRGRVRARKRGPAA
jgi:hypothetical protein